VGVEELEGWKLGLGGFEKWLGEPHKKKQVG